MMNNKQYTVTFFVEDCNGELNKKVLRTEKQTLADAFEVAVNNGADSQKTIKFEYED